MKKTILLCLFVIAACEKISEQNLPEWRYASDSRKDKFVSESFAKKDFEYIKKCITRMGTLPNTERVNIADAGKMCEKGLRIQEERIAAAKKKNGKK